MAAFPIDQSYIENETFYVIPKDGVNLEDVIEYLLYAYANWERILTAHQGCKKVICKFNNIELTIGDSERGYRHKEEIISDYQIQINQMEENNMDCDIIRQQDHGKHYRYSYNGVKLDPYRILKVYNITDPAQQHAIKKLLRAGNSVKDLVRDIEEVILTLTRWKEMIEEDQRV